MKAQHTPGPWACALAGGRWVIWQDVPGRADIKQTKENARLIAAAPDLLAALESLAKWGEAAGLGNSPRSKQRTLFETARAAIAKAREEA